MQTIQLSMQSLKVSMKPNKITAKFGTKKKITKPTHFNSFFSHKPGASLHCAGNSNNDTNNNCKN